MSKILPRITKASSVFSRQSCLIRPLSRCSRTQPFHASSKQSGPVVYSSKISPFSKPRGRTSIIIAAFATFAAASATVYAATLTAHADAPRAEDEAKYLRLDEVHKHGRDAERRWVTRGNRVYDIEDWIPHHPGGAVILQATGGAIDAYWDSSNIHQKQDVYDILEQYFIGLIDDRDLVDGKLPQGQIDDPFSTDPERDQALIVHTERPCNAETPAMDLNTLITPTDKHYVRNHFWVPDVDEESLDLTVELANGERKVYTIQDLQCKFTQHTITATLQCSGNRRSDMSANSRKAQGLPWGIGAISNSSWTGVRLRDVLADAGLSSDPSTAATTCSSSTLAQHVHLIGAEAYAVSVPIHKAIDPWGDVLLVHAMNGQPLSRDHGYPLRVIVPGYVAARSVKWLNKIVLSNEESQSTWHQKDYKCFGPNETSATIDWDKAPSIMEFPVQSAITKIMETSIQSAETTSEDAAVTISGYAHSGGGRRITRVDVSTDDGKSWKQAELLHQDEALGHRAWSWTQWRLIVPKDAVGVACVVKAVDEANNTQPESYAPFWNVRGNLTNSWHRVEVQL